MLFTGSPFTSNWVKEKGDNFRCERGANWVHRRGSPSLWGTAEKVSINSHIWLKVRLQYPI